MGSINLRGVDSAVEVERVSVWRQVRSGMGETQQGW
jgi:hypothetical protein